MSGTTDKPWNSVINTLMGSDGSVQQTTCAGFYKGVLGRQQDIFKWDHVLWGCLDVENHDSHMCEGQVQKMGLFSIKEGRLWGGWPDHPLNMFVYLPGQWAIECVLCTFTGWSWLEWQESKLEWIWRSDNKWEIWATSSCIGSPLLSQDWSGP